MGAVEVRQDFRDPQPVQRAGARAGRRRRQGRRRRGRQAARKAYEEGKWAKITPHQRTHFLLKIAELIDQHAEELAELETLDNGKPLAIAKIIDIPGAAETFRYYAGLATKIYGETNPSDPSMFNYTLREPVGVCGQIIPWNFPLLMAAWKIAPALACGNVVILKPAEQTPLTAIRLGELICEAGLPEGVVKSSPASAPARAARSPSIPISTRSLSPARPKSAS